MVCGDIVYCYDKTDSDIKRSYEGRKPGVYFIKSGEYINIGYTTNLLQRLDDYRRYNPHEVKLMAFHRVPKYGERVYHHIFRKYRLNGKKKKVEWFHYSGFLQEYLSGENLPEELHDNKLVGMFVDIKDWDKCNSFINRVFGIR